MFQLGVQLCSSPSVRVRGVDGPDGSSRPLPVVHVKQRNHCLILVWHAVQGKTIILTKYIQHGRYLENWYLEAGRDLGTSEADTEVGVL